MPIPNWLKEKTPQEKGRRFEKKIAKKVGGRVQPGSGSGPIYKEDVITKELLIQVKKTGKKSYTLKAEDLNNLIINAVKSGRLPVMIIELGGRTWKLTPFINTYD